MEKMNINKEILEIWKECADKCGEEHYPLFYFDTKTNCFLFVGLNPSFSDKAFKTIFEGTKYEGKDIMKKLEWDNGKNVKEVMRIERIGDRNKKKYRTYFGRLKEMAKETGFNDNWEHIDLFFNRVTSQKKFKERFYNKEKCRHFLEAQLRLSLKTIKRIEPKIIVVINAFASDIIKKRLNLKFNKEKGFHELRINDKKIPIFLSSMLSGQRALDKHSYKRLKWHIKKALKKPRD